MSVIWIKFYESQLFVPLPQVFPRGVVYLSGGTASGFTQFEAVSHQTRLLHIREAHRTRIAEVPVSVAHLNSSDCFILDDGLMLYQWNGKDASMPEKSKAIDISRAVRNDRCGRSKVIMFSSTSIDCVIAMNTSGIDVSI